MMTLIESMGIMHGHDGLWWAHRLMNLRTASVPYSSVVRLQTFEDVLSCTWKCEAWQPCSGVSLRVPDVMLKMWRMQHVYQPLPGLMHL